MKTLKALKIASVLNGIFCLFCITFAICITINQYYSTNIIKAIVIFATYGWMLNPSPTILFVVNLVLFLVERHSANARQIIGKKYIWIFIWPVITALFYFVAAGFFIEITGGV